MSVNLSEFGNSIINRLAHIGGGVDTTNLQSEIRKTVGEKPLENQEQALFVLSQVSDLLGKADIGSSRVELQALIAKKTEELAKEILESPEQGGPSDPSGDELLIDDEEVKALNNKCFRQIQGDLSKLLEPQTPAPTPPHVTTSAPQNLLPPKEETAQKTASTSSTLHEPDPRQTKEIQELERQIAGIVNSACPNGDREAALVYTQLCDLGKRLAQLKNR